MDKKLDFLIIGVQKGGTTLLDKLLREHPSIQMPQNKKELHFFDNEAIFANKPDYALYHQYFDFSQKEKIFGEATPIYIFWDEAIKRIYEYNKKIKLIVLLRNPIARAYSQWNMEKNRDLESERFYHAIVHERERSRRALPEQERVFSYVERGFYAPQIRRLLRYFDATQVHFIKSEEFFKNTQKSLDALCEFLEVQKFTFTMKGKVHEGAYQEPLDEASYDYLHKRYKFDIAQVEQLLGWDCSDWLTKRRKKILFFREYHSYTGGHQVLYHYYDVFKKHHGFDTKIFFEKKSLWDRTNPWQKEYKNILKKVDMQEFDLLFLAGDDWSFIQEQDLDSKIVINLIQGMRHLDPKNKLYGHLSKKALRIATSKELAEGLAKTGVVNGPIITIENGVDLKPIDEKKIYDFYILGIKDKNFALKLLEKLREVSTHIQISTELIDKEEVYLHMSRAKVSIVIPNTQEGEGFYLPALESMFYSDVTLTLDAVGNRTFCKDGYNCFVAKRDLDDVVHRAKKALFDDISIIKQNAMQTVQEHSLQKQQSKILKFIDEYLNV